jgi:hypothetical protein
MLLAVVAACGPGHRGGDDMASTDANGGGDSGSTGDGTPAETVYVYAHTDTVLYRVDPDTLAISAVGGFQWPASVGSDQMTDIAIDKTGLMIGVSFDKVYRVDPATAHTTLLSASLDGTFNGLSFVPAEMLGQTGDDVLVGTRGSDGVVMRIDAMSGAATQVGNMGAFQSSGDLVSVAGFGTVQTVLGTSNDQLARLAMQTFAATPIGDTGYGEIWGLAYWKNKVYGFTNGGQFVLIDPATGHATLVSTNGEAWWGAAVTTLAPIIE